MVARRRFCWRPATSRFARSWRISPATKPPRSMFGSRFPKRAFARATLTVRVKNAAATPPPQTRNPAALRVRTLSRNEPAHDYKRARRHADSSVGLVLLPAGGSRRADRPRYRVAADMDCGRPVVRVVGSGTRFAPCRARHRAERRTCRARAQCKCYWRGTDRPRGRANAAFLYRRLADYG